jgi:hypothetical protein
LDVYIIFNFPFIIVVEFTNILEEVENVLTIGLVSQRTVSIRIFISGPIGDKGAIGHVRTCHINMDWGFWIGDEFSYFKGSNSPPKVIGIVCK